MPMTVQEKQRPDELDEFVITGPFAGIQSEIPPEQLERLPNLGLVDCENIIFRKAGMSIRPGLNFIPPPPITLIPDPEDPETLLAIQEPGQGVFDFYNIAGARVSGIITGTRLIQWNGGAQDWLPVSGALTDSEETYATAVVASKLLFSQGIDKVKMWDGASSSFTDASVNAVPARFLMELDNSLIAAYTVEGGNQAHQRIRWTGPLDPTDWTSFGAGQKDLFNDLGPITGLMKILQQGYVFQQWGIMQLIPQPTNYNRFLIAPIATKPSGCICPRSLDKYRDTGVYVGSDNIYMFDGSSAIPFGDRPIEGSARVGARSRIFAELASIDLTTVIGKVTTTLQGTPFNAYWLFLPGASTWLYNFEEANWTRFSWDEVPNVAGVFNKSGPILIRDLIGTIRDQGWTPADLAEFNPLEAFLIAFRNGTFALPDFATPCERPWKWVFPPISMRDHRHNKNVMKARVIMSDLNQLNFAVTIENEESVAQKAVETLLGGAPTGKLSNRVLSCNLPGQYHTASASGQGQMTMTEFAFMYETGGENR